VTPTSVGTRLSFDQPNGGANVRVPTWLIDWLIGGMESVPHLTVPVSSFDQPTAWYQFLTRPYLSIDRPTGGMESVPHPTVSFIPSADWWHGPVPHPAVSSTGQLVAVMFSPRPAVPAICRLLVAVTFSPHLADLRSADWWR
jgi:hypothetical protein